MLHEIRNHLAALDVMAQLVSSKKKDPDFIATLERIFPRETARLLELTESFLDMARQPKDHLGWVDWTELVERALELMTPMFRAQGRTLRWVNPKGMNLRGDARQLESLILNLMRNALEACKPRGKVVVRSRKNPVQGLLVFEVWNEGNSIGPKALGSLFEPFHTTKRTGTGVGLAICRRVVENHVGSIRASVVRQGTLFEVRLPLGEGPKARKKVRGRAKG
jgi:signal transduction histidine kinase